MQTMQVRFVSSMMVFCALSGPVLAQEYEDAVAARCMQRITVYDHGSEAKIRWQQKNCQAIWAEVKKTQVVRAARLQCSELTSSLAPDAHAMAKWRREDCDDFGQ